MIIDTINSAINRVNKTLAEFKVAATIIRNTESYDANTGVNTLIPTEESISGFMDSFSYNEVDNVKVLQDDVKFSILSSEEVVLNSVIDQVKIGSVIYQIVSVKKISIGSSNILQTLQLRV